MKLIGVVVREQRSFGQYHLIRLVQVKHVNEWRRGAFYNGAAVDAEGDAARGSERGAAGREGKGASWRWQADTHRFQDERITEWFW